MNYTILINKYCKFLPVAIRFGQKQESRTEGEGDDAKTEMVDVDNIINMYVVNSI